MPRDRIYKCRSDLTNWGRGGRERGGGVDFGTMGGLLNDRSTRRIYEPDQLLINTFTLLSSPVRVVL